MGHYMYSNTKEVTPYERMAAALNGEKTDRVPVHIYPSSRPGTIRTFMSRLRSWLRSGFNTIVSSTTT
jgi:hypothetical protein